MKTKMICKYCSNEFYSGTLWFIPSEDNLICACDACREKHIDEIVTPSPGVTILSAEISY